MTESSYKILISFLSLSSQVRDQLPHLKAIVQYKGELEQKLPNVYTVSFCQIIQ